MKIKESSELYLYAGVKISNGLQIVFNSRANQTAYFNRKKIADTLISDRKFSYLRRTGRVKVELSTAKASKCDYLSFINPAFENKMFYAKIINYEYISNSVVEFTYSIDYFQTYMFDVVFEGGFIEREHLSEYEHQLSVQNPFRRDLFQLSTAESLQITRDMESTYSFGEMSDLMETASGIGYSNFPVSRSEGRNSCVVIQISDFDDSGMSDIETFYKNFDVVIKSNGTVEKNDNATPGDPEYVPLKIGRGYGIYEINGSTAGSYNAQKKLSGALNWLTFHGLNNNIIGMFQISYEAWDVYMHSGAKYATETAEIVPRKYEVHNQKLLRFPYQYLRVYNNEGDCKEYKYELFKNEIIVSAGNKVPYAAFAYVPMFDGAPMISLIPINYLREGVNPEERVDILTVPQIGYTTDAYLAFLASQYNMNLSSRTDSLAEDVNSTIDRMAGRAYDKAAEGRNLSFGDEAMLTLSGIRNMINSGASNAASNLATGNYAGAISNFGSMSATSAREEATAWQSGGNYLYSPHFAPAEGAFVADRYRQGNVNGTLGYHLKTDAPSLTFDNSFPPGTFTFERVRLLDRYLEIFDNYFSGYGYTSGMIGVPMICKYMLGGTDAIHQPHFAPYFGDMVTYVKTRNMHVIHEIADVASSIEEMFNTGCQFLKGEDL